MIDKPWLKYYGKEVIHKASPEGSMCEYVLSSKEKRLDTVALNYFDRKLLTDRYKKILINV